LLALLRGKGRKKCRGEKDARKKSSDEGKKANGGVLEIVLGITLIQVRIDRWKGSSKEEKEKIETDREKRRHRGKDT